MKQVIEKKLNFIVLFMICVLFLYGALFVLSRINVFLIQVLVASILIYMLLYAVYIFMPIYEYILKNNQLIIRRVFSERYFDEFRIYLNDIVEVKEKEKYPVKFWNVFFLVSQRQEIYAIKTDNMSLYIKPSKDFLKELKKDYYE